jgi:anti-sigma factor ChrR (cupin superfamily)
MCAEYRAGDISPGAALAVAAHVSACPACALLVQEPLTATTAAWAPEADGRKPLDATLPPLLRKVPRGRWRRTSLGVTVVSLTGVSGLGEAVFLLRAAPGADILLPAQADLVLGVAGAARGASGGLSTGDLIEIDRPLQARADPDAGLLALVVGDDGLYRELFDRLLS